VGRELHPRLRSRTCVARSPATHPEHS
jgi:hypothetical protein